ncbi:MAG: hypothetical protein AAGF13_07750 [Pseudomonadota bacterium]
MFKNFAIAATAIALSASAVSANSYFGSQDSFDEGDRVVELELVRADAAGSVILETLKGDVIGSAAVNAGANSDVLVNVEGIGVRQDVIAKLVVNGEVADEIRIQAK